MKRILNLAVIFIIGFAFATITSCKKDKTAKNCVIKTMIHESTSGKLDTTNFSYNNDKKVIAAIERNKSVVYNYFGQSANRIYTDGSSSTRDSIVYGTNGLIKEVYSFNSSNVKIRSYVFTYNSQNQLLQQTETEYPSLAVTISNITYVSDDITNISDGTHTSNLEYYTDKLSTTGDYLYLIQFLNYGGFYLNSKHLLKTINNDANISNFAYEFDGDGNVSKLSITSGASTDKYYFTYFCD